MILKCKCGHSEQDRLHGKNNRVFNETKKTIGMGDNKVYRCTVCGNERTVK